MISNVPHPPCTRTSNGSWRILGLKECFLLLLPLLLLSFRSPVAANVRTNLISIFLWQLVPALVVVVIVVVVVPGSCIPNISGLLERLVVGWNAAALATAAQSSGARNVPRSEYALRCWLAGWLALVYVLRCWGVLARTSSHQSLVLSREWPLFPLHFLLAVQTLVGMD